MDKVQGIADIELNEAGKEQARQTMKLLENEKIDLIISSPLTRAKQTVEIITEKRNIKMICDERLIERDYGEFEGKTKEIFEFGIYSKNLKYEKAESIRDFFEKIFNFFDDMKHKEEYKDKTILLTIHGRVSIAVDAYFNVLLPEGEPTKMS